MADLSFPVRVSAGSLRGDPAFTVPHAWSEEGIAVEAGGSGAHLLHVAVAACVLNDLYREAERLGLTLAGVAVAAEGGFEPDNWTSTGITYRAELDGDLDPTAYDELLAIVDQVAEIPRAVRAGASVERRTAERPVEQP